jgi:hypothetical protein
MRVFAFQFGKIDVQQCGPQHARASTQHFSRGVMITWHDPKPTLTYKCPNCKGNRSKKRVPLVLSTETGRHLSNVCHCTAASWSNQLPHMACVCRTFETPAWRDAERYSRTISCTFWKAERMHG